MKALLVGAGAVGARATRQLVEADEVTGITVVDERAESRAALVHNGGPKVRDGGPGDDVHENADVVVLAGPAGTHVEPAQRHLAAGRAVVSCSDDIDDVQALLALDDEARRAGVPLVVGAGFSPGYTCVLARHAAAELDRVDEIHIARS